MSKIGLTRKKIHPIAFSLRIPIKSQTEALFVQYGRPGRSPLISANQNTSLQTLSTHSTFLEISTAMKLTSLSKTVRTLGVMTILSVMVGTTAANACPNARGNKTPNAPVATRPAQAGTIVEIAAGNPAFSTLVTAVKAAGLAETLSGKGPFTVFAPTNEAFAALPEGTLEKLLKPENRDMLRKVLTYHVVSGDVMAKDLRSGPVATVEGNPVAVQVQNGSVKVNNANVVKADIDAKNGVIHVIDAVLLPPGL